MKGTVIKDEVRGAPRGLIMWCHAEVFYLNSETGRFGKVLSRGVRGLPWSYASFYLCVTSKWKAEKQAVQ